VSFNPSLAYLEKALDHFSPEKRKSALMDIIALYKDGSGLSKAHDGKINLHAHTFFSYNAYGYSPTALAWKAKKEGLDFIGIVDFDVLDGVDEFLNACEVLEIRGVAGIETRVFIPGYKFIEINSPGEPGIAYHMGTGFTSSTLSTDAQLIFDSFRERASERNYAIVQKLNSFLAPLALDFEREVLPLSPTGNVTERHIVHKLIEKSFSELENPKEFWREKLNISFGQVDDLLNDSVEFEKLVRKKLIKRGGIAYVTPDPAKFPTISEFNEIIRAVGAIPCMAWLDGTSEGERDIKKLLEFMIEKGVRAVNIIPDRNWNISDPEVKTRKVEALYKIVELANVHHLPIMIGTEMNSPGQKFVDNLDEPELSVVKKTFQHGAQFIYGHTRLERIWGLGYQSSWVQEHFEDQTQKIKFYIEAGENIPPGVIDEKVQNSISISLSPKKILRVLSNGKKL
jgi:hypothetical protein